MSFLRRKNKKKKKPAESAVATRNTDDPFDHGKEFKDPVESYRMPLLEHLACRGDTGAAAHGVGRSLRV